MILSLLALALSLPLLQDGAEQASTGFPGTGLGRHPRVEIPFNRFYDDAEIYAHLDRLAAEWPGLLSHEVIGHSVENREMRVYTLTNRATGAAADKPAMWVDANVHGNEIQGAEVCLYLAWYLLENHGHNAEATRLVDERAFYILPMVNPDGRHSWIHDPHGASSSRTGRRPIDDDRDGQADEDGYDDLDGDGHITQMRKYLPGEGTHRLNADDPRIMERVPTNDRGIRGDWVLLGSEGVDNDGDGRINEDGEGGYDMNRAWPSLWRPEHVQYGAGPYPLCWPEARCIATFLLAHPNVAAVQSFHNSGGMILRGPGAETFGSYPRADVAVYDELGREGEKMLPFYRYMVIWKDLYTVFGGFVTWTYEGLGIISFTNELWASARNFPDRGADGGSSGAGSEGAFGRRGGFQDDRFWFDDNLLMGGGFVDWHPLEHPFYGAIEVGGFKKDVGRVPPTFLIEEMLHRNALFCISHALAMPIVSIDEPSVTDLGGGLRAIDVVYRDERAIPTRTARAAEKRVGTPDVFTLEGGGIQVVAGGFRGDRWRPERIELAEREPGRLLRESGIGGRDEVRVRWIVRGTGAARIGWSGEKARDVARPIRIE